MLRMLTSLVRKKFSRCRNHVSVCILRLYCNADQMYLPELDLEYLLDPNKIEEIKNNIIKRKSLADIDKVHNLHQHFSSASSPDEKKSLWDQMIQAALRIPNKSHPGIHSLNEEPFVIKTIGEDVILSSSPSEFHEIASRMNCCRTENISNYTGPRSYYFMDDISSLEQALVKYAVNHLKKLNFAMISVPDVLPRVVIEHCGMDTRGERNQVYSLYDKSLGDFCLSGTAEMGIAYYLSRRKIEINELPLKLMAVSRCFRAETSKISEEKGVYRVHQFTKVEMFGVSTPSESSSLLDEFTSIQEELFAGLRLRVRLLDMPPADLGPQAFRKFDIEAWLPGRQMWGELSSASDCTDYQSRRLGIKNDLVFLHTVNGTACAVPRLILALLETHQKCDGSIQLPEKLAEILGSNTLRRSRVPSLTTFKTRARFS